MPSIQECIIIEPPTSSGVRERVSEAIEKRQLLPLRLLAQQDVPRPVPFAVEIDILRTTHPQFGENDDTTIEGWQIDPAETADGKSSIIIKISADPDVQATASLVTG